MKYADHSLSYSNNNIDDGLWYLDDIRKFKKNLYENERIREDYEQTSKVSHKLLYTNTITYNESMYKYMYAYI